MKSVVTAVCVMMLVLAQCAGLAYAKDEEKDFTWWPTDAKPAPVKDEVRSGYWWWPEIPGEARPWGNRGYVYVYKIIYGDKGEPSLLIKKILTNVKIYFDYDKADLRPDAMPALEAAARRLKKYPETDILITGNCDTRGTIEYNNRLGEKRADAVRDYIKNNGIDASRVRIISRGKLDAVAPVDDLVGMQKDRNAQFMIAEVEEVNIPDQYKPKDGTAVSMKDVKTGDQKVETVNLEGEVKVSTKEYVTVANDSLWHVAVKFYGRGTQWKRIYEFNKDKIKNPNKLPKGLTLLIPIE